MGRNREAPDKPLFTKAELFRLMRLYEQNPVVRLDVAELSRRGKAERDLITAAVTNFPNLIREIMRLHRENHDLTHPDPED